MIAQVQMLQKMEHLLQVSMLREQNGKKMVLTLIRAQYTHKADRRKQLLNFLVSVINKSSEIFPVDIPNSGTFDVGFTIRGGEVDDY